MTVLFDTNIWMSAAWSPTTQCRKLLRLAKWKRAVFVTSHPLLDELEEKLIGKFA